MKYTAWLPIDEYLASLSARDADSRIFGAFANADDAVVLVITGDGSAWRIPFSAFPVSGDGTAPDFEDVAPADYGHTLRLGPYEASAEAVLADAERVNRRP